VVQRVQAAELAVPGGAVPSTAHRREEGLHPAGELLILCSQKPPFVFSEKRHSLGRLRAEDLGFLSLQRKVLDKGGIWLGSDWVGERVSRWFLEALAEKSWVHGDSAVRAAHSSSWTRCLCTGGCCVPA